jgi:hypothetical protein
VTTTTVPPPSRPVGTTPGRQRPRRGLIGALCRLSGTDPAGPDTAVRKGIAAACLLLVVAAMATGSGALFAHDLVNLSWTAAIPLGFAWGLAVLMIDRGVLVFMSDAHGLRRIVTGVVRLLMAALLGYVVAEPLVLRIFEQEVDVALAQGRADAVADGLTKVDENPEYGTEAIAALEKRVADLRTAAAASADPAAVDNDPEVVRIRDELAVAVAARDAQQDLVECESDGTCGTGNAGDGPEWQRKLDELARLDGVVTRIEGELTTAEGNARTRAGEAATATQQGAEKDLPQAEADLAAAVAEARTARDDATASGRSLDGLGARMESLDELREGSSSINREYLLITALLIVIDTSAVVLKLLQRPTEDEELKEMERRGQIERMQAELEHLRTAQGDEHAWDRDQRGHDREAMATVNDEVRQAFGEDSRRALDSERPRGPGLLRLAVEQRQQRRLNVQPAEPAGPAGNEVVIDLREGRDARDVRDLA